MSPADRLPPVARRVLAGDRRAIGQLISAVENADPSALPALRALFRRAPAVPVVGLTGPLGVGKSSVINSLLGHLRAADRTVGVIAVDPSSPFSGGSVLGDRIRLDRRPGDQGVFIRSMASRGHAGGVAAATREVTRILAAAGMQVVLVETVGSGQVDVEIRSVASTNVVVLVPHLGDEVQTLKAGLFEIADVFCVNKSDLPGADSAARDLSELVALGPGADGWRAPVLTASTRTGEGIPGLWAAIEAHERWLDTSGRRAEGERRRAEAEVLALVRRLVEEQLTGGLAEDAELRGVLDQVVAQTLDPHAAAERVLKSLRRYA